MSVTLVNHPLILHKLASLRDKTTGSDKFRQLLGELAVQIFLEASKEQKTIAVKVDTPFAECSSEKVEQKFALIPIMRAGIGMQESIQRFWPDCSVGHIGIYRDKFLNTTVEYFCKMPKELDHSVAYVLDPVIATGTTAAASVSRLYEMGATEVKFLSIIACEEGLALLASQHPELKIFTVSTTEQLSDNGYLTPGIGDVGARYYNNQ
ncbi:uracil phosphoribosyltransferase [Halioxenophilus sp. WMMB6]|uniref:uracil phosphoribosyltransferase n=1 Tax=Halioxenophilus sp. WMMB6 TaxID=3073815 RepID=UPI00295E9AF0|nr:uracil phosphoribosyltransferase [Halioxenophilus sp. WMMB6]